MFKEIIYIVNPLYDLKTDKNRVIITNRTNDPVGKSFIGFVHPLYAIILSFFNGEYNLIEVIDRISSTLKMNRNDISNIVSPLLENETDLYFNYEGYQLSFPEKLLIKKNDNLIAGKFDTQALYIPKKDLDMKSWRLHSLLDAIFMVTKQCVTDCSYCYADRQRKTDGQISFNRLKDLIREAKKLKMRSFDLTGGELFLYEKWEELLSELISNGFTPYISTKFPMGMETIEKLKNLGIKRIQISIDSIIKDELKVILGVKEDYLNRLLETLKNLDNNDFEIYTNTLVNSVNQENIYLLLDYLLKLKNIKRIALSAAGFSLYKGEEKYRMYKPDLEHLKRINIAVNDLKIKYENKININFSGYPDKGDLINISPEGKMKNFNNRSRCSANFYAFIILPDGKVTICEELYWHPKFIIGDLTKQSIEEVWNSKRAIELYNISKEMIRDGSECKTCDEFESCHRYKGVCWKEVLYAYGYENWDYPDPKCPYARKPTIEYYP